ncbi:MAG: hypothetical protein A2233_01990 [Candidatus Kerfeldbacteria bacterium RIFOXYA2_FULL_38_24]|uniref:Uncharacterized protein n=1 Tax=Candidatus Kerfeldbacteria bacterium RIFOXYB2_FULL_38_14 TaxID=1798547 RepID=A0A1G2BG72_9BACT|nr:MAG: hypothetical protein A2319_04590 [Candidatus Kerfeldbacteria bacterium RIFOXYB2_FULL_38_14]OGY87886.1 MAG: hypothetical protein A2233_01990 [Candidatus Kerfeldbacteria bacterium RIFOXYA2_FULL_38_24]OGY88698.1 MAG: hypothetical protein A2458_03615 [Candidatus Kerfeldbacteria bacterium RIFOXYC2_FULL_38_9]
MISLTDKIKKTIAEKNMHPKPQWLFIIRDMLVWSAIFLTIILLSLALSLSWEILFQQRVFSFWTLRPHLSLFLSAMPFFWFLCAVIFVLVAYFEFRKTKSGYQINFILVITGVFITSLVLSLVLCATGLSQRLEYQLEDGVMVYHSLVPLPHQHWLQPTEGLLSGVIIATKPLLIKDWEEQQWRVVFTEESEIEENILTIGRSVRLIGQQTGKNEFTALVVLPWNRLFFGQIRLFEQEETFLMK